MDEQILFMTIVIAIATLAIGNILVFYYLSFRDNQMMILRKLIAKSCGSRIPRSGQDCFLLKKLWVQGKKRFRVGR